MSPATTAFWRTSPLTLQLQAQIAEALQLVGVEQYQRGPTGVNVGYDFAS